MRGALLGQMSGGPVCGAAEVLIRNLLSGLGVWGLGFRGLGFRVLGFRVGLGVQGLGFWKV